MVPEFSSRYAMMETLDKIYILITELNASNDEQFHFVLCVDMNAHTLDSPNFVSNSDILSSDYNIDIFTDRW